MKKFKLQLRKLASITFFLPLIILSVIFFLTKNFLLVQINQTLQEKRELEGYIQQENVLQNKALFLQNLNPEKLDVDIEKVNKALPFDKNIASILNSLDYLKNETGVNIVSLGLKPGTVSTIASELPKKSKEKKKTTTVPYLEFPFSISLSGEEGQVEKFISQINQNVRLFKIEKTSISYQKDNLIKANFSLVAFYLPPPSRFGGVTTPLPELSENKKQVLDQITQLKSPPVLTSDLTLEKEYQATTPSVVRKNLFSF